MKLLNSINEKVGYILNPLLITFFPLFSFYGANASEIQSGEFSISTFLIFNSIIGFTIFVTSLMLTRHKEKASILAVLAIFLFFMFGRIHGLLGEVAIKTPFMIFGPSKILLIVFFATLLTTFFIITKISIKKSTTINYYILIISGVMVFSTIITIIPSVIKFRSTNNVNQSSNEQQQTITSSGKSSDIYYILLDGYARQDILSKTFDYDNSEFIDGLKSKGFYVAENANANYAHTHFSVPSTFNMKYLNYLTEEMGAESTDRRPLRDLTQHNAVVKDLKSLGYKYVNIGSQWGWTMSSPYNDIEIKEDGDESKILGIELDEFALVYLQTTALKPWIEKDIRGNLLARILGAFEKIDKVAKIDDPTFTFAHIVSPHPPYLFGREGVIEGQSELELLNQGFSDRTRFADQTHYVNKLILDIVDKLQKNSSDQPIIIIASDHGPASSLNQSDFSETDPNKFDKEGIKERMGILNTYYFPDKNYSKLYPEISPVNSFRLIFSQYLGRQDLELLPDYNYFSNNKENEYKMHDVTKLLTE